MSIWAEVAKLLGPVLAGLGGGLLDEAPFQERQSFGTASSISPPRMLKDLRSKVNTALAEQQARLKQGVHLKSAFVQSPPSYAGGGMPMPFGVTGRDPALSIPALLSPGTQTSSLVDTSTGSDADEITGPGWTTPVPNPEPGAGPVAEKPWIGMPGRGDSPGDAPTLAYLPGFENPWATDPPNFHPSTYNKVYSYAPSGQPVSPYTLGRGGREEALAAFRMLGLEV